MSLRVINNFNECLETVNKTHFYIQDGDDQKPAFIVENNGEFEVTNNTSSPINFLKTDACVSSSNDNKRCDCAIYNDDTFCFIELKSSKRTNWKSHRETAEKQLKATILDFKNEDIAKNKTLEAYMCCTSCDIDGNRTRILRASNSSDVQIYFKDILKTRLYCGTKKEFN
ncbi:hypothetical protein JHD49_05145 [Sulfurimonas sp. SAG-AH-194-C21]|nr:hypothetical protein [Sulfurimonas sp. SAG-AH-194-C21]MDF1883321.1 hypothetical protein [Sulfurimonas sp. SAG-AH-194-C21]